MARKPSARPPRRSRAARGSNVPADHRAAWETMARLVLAIKAHPAIKDSKSCQRFVNEVWWCVTFGADDEKCIVDGDRALEFVIDNYKVIEARERSAIAARNRSEAVVKLHAEILAAAKLDKYGRRGAAARV